MDCLCTKMLPQPKVQNLFFSDWGIITKSFCPVLIVAHKENSLKNGIFFPMVSSAARQTSIVVKN